MAGAERLTGFDLLIDLASSLREEIGEQTGLHRRHCEEPRGPARGRDEAIF